MAIADRLCTRQQQKKLRSGKWPVWLLSCSLPPASFLADPVTFTGSCSMIYSKGGLNVGITKHGNINPTKPGASIMCCTNTLFCRFVSAQQQQHRQKFCFNFFIFNQSLKVNWTRDTSTLSFLLCWYVGTTEADAAHSCFYICISELFAVILNVKRPNLSHCDSPAQQHGADKNKKVRLEFS